MIEGSCLCGSVRYRAERTAGPMVHCHCGMLRAGCIDRGVETPAVAHGWVDSMAPWHLIDDDLPRFGQGFPGSPPGAEE